MMEPEPQSVAKKHSREPVRIPCHSHNDYWREQPLLSALRAGCISVEADVWAFENELYVGHEQGVLTPERTFSSLYVDPLVQMLRDKSLWTAPLKLPLAGGDIDPRQTLVLLVDLKSDIETAWPLMLEKLAPLRQQGWLSYASGQTIFPGPVTVVATGNARLEAVIGDESHRTIFLDAPLAELEGGAYERHNSYYASVSFAKSIGTVHLGNLRPSQLDKVQHHVRTAHERGLKARYWGLPSSPVDLRNYIWDVLIHQGVDVLNVDDLEGVREAYTRDI